MRAIIATLALLLTTATATAAAAAEPDYPAPNGRRVIDAADQIPDDIEKRLTDDLRDFQRKSGHEMVIVTVPTLEGMSKEDYAIGYGRHWGIGRKGVDDGVVLLESPGDGKPGSGQVFIAVGRGFDAYMTDFATSRVFNQIMLPVLRGDPGSAGEGLDKDARIVKGIEAGVAALIRVGSITPEQRRDMEHRLAMQRAIEHQAHMDTLWDVIYSILGLGAAGGTGFGIWRFATRKRRARERAAAIERAAKEAEALAARRAEEAAERAAAAERHRLAVEKAARDRADMLAAMTPAARQSFLDEEERQAREAREAAERAAAARRAQEARERASRAEQDARDQAAADERNRAAAAAASTSSYESSTYSAPEAPSQNDYNPGGGDFGGAGSGGSF